MKKLIRITIISVLVLSTSIGCKKGENDPFSLLSRTARLTGVWNLTSADYDKTDIDNGGTEITSYTYDGTSMTETTDGEGSTYEYAEEITINKDGTFVTITEEEIEYFDFNDLSFKTGIRTETIEGVWYFLDGNKDLEVKNKERVEFLLEKYKQVDPDGDTYEYEMAGLSNAFVNIVLLDKLANDELVTLFDYIQTFGGDSNSKSGTMTYTKK